MHNRRPSQTVLGWAAVLVVALGLVVAGPGAGAHALRQSSDPTAGATLASSPSQVVITFTERPDLRSSLIEVLDTSGRKLAGGSPQLVAGQPPTVVRIPVTATLAKGVYTVNWKTVSQEDGHLATGAFSFGVQVAPTWANASVGVVTTSRPGALASTSRFVYLAGLIGLLGLLFTAGCVLAGGVLGSTPAPRRLWRAVAVSWVLAAAGCLGIAQSQAAAAGLSLGALASSSIGQALALRFGPLMVLGAVLLMRRRGRPLLWLAGALTLVAMLGDVLRTHAAAAPAWVWFRVGTQLVHFAAAGIWIGGLAGLLLCIAALEPSRRGAAARRFSFWALISFAVVGLTGTLRALDEVGGWHALFHTGFGQLIIVKSALFVVLGALGALNRFRHVATAGAAPRGLRRTGTVELAAMAAVLVATAVLQNLNPPRSAAAPAARPTVPPIVAVTSDFAQFYRMKLTVSPGTPGFNTFTLGLTDYQTGRPVQPTSVSLSFHAPNNPTVGDSTLELIRRPGGTYGAQGPNLSLLGRWTVTILVQNGDATVDVPIDLVTQSPPQQTTVQRFTGLPTVYTVALGGGDQLQIYVDPINLGKAEFHATFIDATGKEIAMANTLAVTAAPSPGGPIGPLQACRQLSAGHFGCDGPGRAGTYVFTVAGVTAGGTALGDTIPLTIG